MAHHNSTPASVLNAPKSEPIVIREAIGLSRDERRGRRSISKERAKEAHGHANTPFVGKVRDALAGEVA